MSKQSENSETYSLACWLLVRLIALTYVIAFTSLIMQMHGLIGHEGIVPIESTLKAHVASFGDHAFLYRPTLFWLNNTDGFLEVVAIGGLVASLLACVGIISGPALTICWIAYLSICNVGAAFFQFQWDQLLLECGLLALFLMPWSVIDPVLRKQQITYNSVVLTLFRWLLFRVMFFSGIAKLTSSSDCWRSFSALTNYYETQLLPNAASWYLHNLPRGMHKAIGPLVFVLELFVPVLYYAPRKFRVVAGISTVLLQLAMFLSGNHGFVNLLTAILCLTLFDDLTLGRFVPVRLKERFLISDAEEYSTFTGFSVKEKILVAFVVALTCCVSWQTLLAERYRPAWLKTAVNTLTRGYHLTGSYGLYPIVMPERTEIVIEGSNDRINWKPYEFKYHIGDVALAPPTVAPYQPRLDWRMRFAAIDYPEYVKWFHRFVSRLQSNSPAVVSLLKSNPFPDSPPHFIRADVYRYSFTSAEQRKQTGNWWKRTLIARYMDPIDQSGNTVPFAQLEVDRRSIPLWGVGRRTFFAGHYYSASSKGLKQEIDTLMRTATATEGKQFSGHSSLHSVEKPVLAIIAPHASYRYSGVTAARAFQCVREQEVKRIFLIGPFHHRNSEAFSGAALPESSTFATPLGWLSIDVSAVRALAASKLFLFNEQAHRKEHSLEMQLPLIKHSFSKVQIVPILLGKLASTGDAREIAKAVRAELRAGDLVIVSADMTHYGKMYDFSPPVTNMRTFTEQLDNQAFSAIERKDMEAYWRFHRESKDYVCGFESILVLMAMLPEESHATVIDYSTSQDAGVNSQLDPQRCVGYLSAAFSGGRW